MCCHSEQGSQEPFFYKAILGHTQQRRHKTNSTPLPPAFPDLLDLQICHQSIVLENHQWDHLGEQTGQPTCLVEFEVCLQQLWNEMFQDIIRNLYV
ncbi:hypothetical protein TNCV_3431761 [Trichonephila clavipes]|nr:hypothetical protein TNCV_3431761 [Trichonephila clavipes]